jgi:hypothetical protein
MQTLRDVTLFPIQDALAMTPRDATLPALPRSHTAYLEIPR